MPFDVNQFRSNMIQDGARPNLFEVFLTFPTLIVPEGIIAGERTRFLAKASQLPGSTIGMVPLYYFGREAKFAGNRTFADWTLTIINDEDFFIKNALERWSNGINSNASNVRDFAALSPLGYTVDADVVQYGKDGIIKKQYTFVGMFPVDIAPIDLDWGSNDTIEEYTVTFAYQWWESNTTS